MKATTENISTKHGVQFLLGNSDEPAGFSFSVERITEKAILLNNGKWVPKSQIRPQWIEPKGSDMAYQKDTFMCTIPQWLLSKVGNL